MGTVWDLAFNPKDSSQFCSVSNLLEVFIWKDLQLVHRLETKHQLSIYTCSWSARDLLVTGGQDNQLCLYDTSGEEPSLIQTLNAHQMDINCAEFNPKFPDLLCTVSDDTSVKLWKLQSISDESSI